VATAVRVALAVVALDVLFRAFTALVCGTLARSAGVALLDPLALAGLVLAGAALAAAGARLFERRDVV
jgi:hypothetical protein